MLKQVEFQNIQWGIAFEGWERPNSILAYNYLVTSSLTPETFQSVLHGQVQDKSHPERTPLFFQLKT